MAFTVAVIVSVALAPLANVPTVHAPVPLLKVPALGAVLLTKVYPDGKTSVTDTVVAALGPALFAVSVKMTLLPTFGVALLTVFIMPTLACAAVTGTGVLVEVLLPGVGSVSVAVIVAVLA